MNSFRTWVKDTAERVVVTFVAAALAVFVGSGVSQWDPSTGYKVLTAGLVAAAVAIKQAVFPALTGLSAWLDVTARAAWSAVQTAAVMATASAGFDWYSATAWQTVLVASLAAGVSVIKGAYAVKRPVDKPTITPASLAPAS